MKLPQAVKIVCLLLLVLPAAVQAQFTFTTNNDGSLNIYRYTGSGGAVAIPDTTNGLPVTSIGTNAFNDCTSLTSITIPNSVTSIGFWAFGGCASLTSVTIPNSVTNIGNGAFGVCAGLSAITVGALNPVYSSVGGLLFNKSQTTLITYPGGKVGGYTIPNTVTSIGNWAFIGCNSLTSVSIPNSVTSIGDLAFDQCNSLTGVYFEGNAPSVGSGIFNYDNNPTVYYLPGTINWSTNFGDCLTAPWYLPNPLILNGPSFGVQTNGFGFIISWATNIPVVVEACTNPANPIWSSVTTNTLTGGWCNFSDPQWTNYPARFYRLRSP